MPTNFALRATDGLESGAIPDPWRNGLFASREAHYAGE
jgi:hypothetical protein